MDSVLAQWRSTPLSVGGIYFPTPRMLGVATEFLHPVELLWKGRHATCEQRRYEGSPVSAVTCCLPPSAVSALSPRQEMPLQSGPTLGTWVERSLDLCTGNRGMTSAPQAHEQEGNIWAVSHGDLELFVIRN